MIDAAGRAGRRRTTRKTSGMPSDLDGTLRARMAKLMADGLKTQTEPFPDTTEAFTALVNACGDLAPDDLVGKMVLTGWIDKPYGEDNMRCQECMYYLVHRKWCDLPELDLPAEPDWWCRLWRI
jgi:hypothetical protein